MVGSTGGTEGFGVEFGGEVVAVKDHVRLYAVVTQHFDSVHGVVDVSTCQYMSLRERGREGDGLCGGVSECEVPGTGIGSAVEPDVSIDADDFACVLFDVRVDLDGFQQREKTRDSHRRKDANKCRVNSNSFKILKIDG